MANERLLGALDFLREAERLKSTLRSGFTSTGRSESTAEHTWRLCLMALVFSDEFGDIDPLRLIKLCIVHDLGEALSGDIPAVLQTERFDKSAQERADLKELTRALHPAKQAEILALWEEYEAASSPEAVLAKGLDKLETILQHNQGRNPVDFDYAFNLDYGRKHTSAHPILAEIRVLLDEETRVRAGGSKTR
ncbi:HD domain-containing protein [Microvirga terrae]|uniref:HD domain-containing protein n=1 Tax=Microvirga terrae TaxID=2740529 RepID=A0ABY5RU26_9HYPH|nr:MULTISPECIES: HD domain-containing protein [Microvirga]MBQ0819246.1 HD domain-containing protein [Microvirga sp. HBU67558]UVF20765.1 HD domain-containing protein [Microvirga terrae]